MPLKKKINPTPVYVIIDKETGDYFCNKNQKSVAAVRHHFHRANNPNREDYNSEFYTLLREKGEDGFKVKYYAAIPEWVQRRAIWLEANDGSKMELTKPDVIYEEEKQ